MCYSAKLMWEINTVHKILNLKGIYAILSRIWKCRKSRVLVLIFWVKKLVGANFLRFCNSAFHSSCQWSLHRRKGKQMWLELGFPHQLSAQLTKWKTKLIEKPELDFPLHDRHRAEAKKVSAISLSLPLPIINQQQHQTCNNFVAIFVPVWTVLDPL